MTALRFRGETSDIPGLPSGVLHKENKNKTKKKKKKGSCYSTVIKLFYNCTLPQKKRSLKGKCPEPLELHPPGLALDSEPLFLHDTLLHGTPSCQVWLKTVEQFRRYRPDKIIHTDSLSDSNPHPPPPCIYTCVCVWGGG